ncbi:hypothetical protein G3O08_16670 [Cryomorpha ignava]|uniref:Gliding motility-associated C-terminal domain-containing protein n=1 Tax=Cryomorpha ignava TaxID=101383 RepID=A0A7K3WUG9_9FLAO|nr:hypothetical protein [Cryomorpha ignava]NEN25136.1 hypothetical protein [Cryomorpha ignava]
MRLSLIILSLTLLSNFSFAQMDYWTLPPYQYHMSLLNPTHTTLPGNQSNSFSVANGAYEPNGNLVFYVKDDGIYDDQGVFVNNLPIYMPYPNGPVYDILSGEIAIVPIPNECKKYYIIYSMDNPGGFSPLLYIKIDCTGTSPVLTYDSTFPYIKPFIISNQGGSDNTAFAVSQTFNPASNPSRFLLAAKELGIYKSIINSSGISTGVEIASYNTLNLQYFDDFATSTEAEISWGTNYFAWCSIGTDKVFIIKIDPSDGTYVPNSIKSFSISDPKGIEFDSNLLNPNLFVSCSQGIKKISTLNNSTTTISTGPYDLSNTFLEYGSKNKIYGVSPVTNGGKLIGISTTNSSISTVSGIFDSQFTLANYVCQNIYTLPDQIDGENYNTSVIISDFTINSNIPSLNCDRRLEEYCQDNPIAFNANYFNGGIPYEYKFAIYPINSSCLPISVKGQVNYHGSWQTGEPILNFDLRSLTDGVGKNLGNSSGSFAIQYSVKDVCGNINTQIRYISVVDQIPAQIALEIYNMNNSQVYLSPSQNINTPVYVGTSSIGIHPTNYTA